MLTPPQDRPQGSASESLYRILPNLGLLLETAAFSNLLQVYSRELLTETTRTLLADLRSEIAAGLQDATSVNAALARLPQQVEQALILAFQPSLRPVINATGVILQTNLGRAPLSREALANLARVAGGYCNLELDLETGGRSYRDRHVEQLILRVLVKHSGFALESLPGKAAAVVNNCAAACFLALHSLASGGEVIVSRGELVEIGGGFRIPDILERSGAILREVGTTNRTRLSDYERALTPQTRLILRVHRSNFRIEGFTEQPSLASLQELAARHGIPLFEDQGTGSLFDLSSLGLHHEPSLAGSLSSGAALVACSGDKLLGGPQCGLLIGAKEHVEKIRGNPLFRAMRVDKLTYAALETTLLAWLSNREDTLPTVAMVKLSPENIHERCDSMSEWLAGHGFQAEVIATRTMIGGGTTPGASLPSFSVALRHPWMSESAFAAQLRALEPAVMTRIQESRVLLDLRTVAAHDDHELTALLQQALELPFPGQP